MKALALALLAFLIGSCQAQSKQAAATCIREEESGRTKMTFKLVMNAEPQGRLDPVNNTEYNKTPRVYERLPGCDSTFQNNAYAVESYVSVDDGLDQAANPCGAEILTDGNGDDYIRWKLLYTSDGDDMLEEFDRLFVIECRPSTTQSNMVVTQLTVTTPDLIEDAPVLGLIVALSVLVRGTNGQFAPATTANAGDLAKLRLTLTREANFNPAIHTYGIYGYRSYAWYTSSTDPTGKDLLIDNNGCAYDGTLPASLPNEVKIPPYPAAHGYRGTVSATSNQYYSDTGEFFLWKYRASNTVYFWTSFVAFDDADKNDLDNPCLHFTGVNGRRKRSSDRPNYEVTISATITVNPAKPDKTTADETTSRQVAIIVGAVAGAVIVMLVAGLVCLVTILTGKRRRTKSQEASRTSSVVSIVPQDKK